MVASTVSEQVQQTLTINPRNISFNTNFNLPDNLGTADIDIHQSGELLAQYAEETIRQNSINPSQADINKIKDEINYATRSDKGQGVDKIAMHQERMKAIRTAQAQATAIAEAQAMGLEIPLEIKESMAEKISIAQGQKQSVGQAIGQATAQPIGQPTKQATANNYRNAVQQQMSQALAYTETSIDSFFIPKALNS